MGISIDTFIKSYKVKTKTKDDSLKDFISKHITATYIPYATKYAYCVDIVEKTTHLKNGNRRIIKIDTAMQDLFFTMKLIELYTDIEFNENKVIDEYDKLSEVGVIDKLLACIPETEFAEFFKILGMKMNDFYTNEYSLEALAYNLKESLSISEETINSVIDEIKNKKEIPE